MAEKEKTRMQQATWYTRLGPSGSMLGAILTGMSIFLPLILTGPPPDTRFPDPYPPTLNGVWILRSLFSSQRQFSSLLPLLLALLVVLALITLGTSISALLLQANVSGIVSWMRILAAMSSLVVLLWFLEGVALLNVHLGFGTGGMASPRFSPGFGIVFLVLGAILSALGSGRMGIGALVGVGIGFLLFFTPLFFFAFIIGTITCMLGGLLGWWRERASSKSTPVASS